LDQFLTAHPQVNLSIRASNELLNLNRREADLAIRISDSPGDTLMGRRLTGQKTASFCTAEVLAKIQADPEKRVDWLGFEHWSSVPNASKQAYPNGRIKLKFDDMTALVGAAKMGLGVARLPLFLGRSEGLILAPFLPPQPYTDIWAVAHKDLWASAKVTAFKDILVAFFREHRSEFEDGS
jgi:DNA-binding transcriptional LysR family regulator